MRVRAPLRLCSTPGSSSAVQCAGKRWATPNGPPAALGGGATAHTAVSRMTPPAGPPFLRCLLITSKDSGCIRIVNMITKARVACQTAVCIKGF